MSAVSATPRSTPAYHTQNGRLSATPPASAPRPPSTPSPHSPLLRMPSRHNSLNSTTYDPPSPIHAGCVLCGMVASAASQSMNPGITSSPTMSPMDSFLPLPLPSPVRAATPDLQRGAGAGPSSQPYGARSISPSPLAAPRLIPRQPPPEIIIGNHRIIYRDDDVTIYPAEGKEALCPDGRHLIVVLNRHLTSVYELGPADIPLVSKIINTTQRLLLERAASSAASSEADRTFTAKDVRIGFVNGMPADPAIPHQHLHAQAFLGPFDRKLPGSTMWRRTVVFNPFNWWGLEDLRAEIREECSNNRVKSGYDDRYNSPIDKVPDAGAFDGLPNALDPDAYADADSLASNSPPAATRKDSSATLKAPARPFLSVKVKHASGDYTPVRTNVGPEKGRVLVGRNSSTSTTASDRNSTSTVGSNAS